MTHNKLQTKIKSQNIITTTLLLLSALSVFLYTQKSTRIIITNIQATLATENLKSLQSAQRSLSLNHIFYTPNQLLDEWITLQNKDKNWHKNLPYCPEEIILKQHSNGEILVIHPNPKIWHSVTLSGSLHGKAIYELRSRPIENSSSQCTYNKEGKLYKSEIPEAGSSDFYSPSVNRYLHHIYDVEPYILARALKRSDVYYKARPPK